MSSSTNIFSLPNELILEIARYLSGKSLRRFAQATTSLREIVNTVVAAEEKADRAKYVLLWPAMGGQNRPDRYLTHNIPSDIRIVGNSLDSRTLYEYNTLISACEKGDIDSVRKQLEHVSPNPPECKILNRYAPRWHTPVEAALRANRIDCFDLLVSAEADLARFSFEDKVRLILSDHPGDRALRESLVRHGLDISEAGLYGKTLLFEVCDSVGSWGDLSKLGLSPLELIPLLLDHGLDIDARGPYGHNALCYAIRFWPESEGLSSEMIDIVRVLLSRGADNGETALLLACRFDKPDIALLILDEFKPDARLLSDSYGSLLFSACFHGHTEIVNHLLQEDWWLYTAPSVFDAVLGREDVSLRVYSSLRLIYDAWVSRFGLEEPHLLYITAASLGDVSMLMDLEALRRTNPETLNFDRNLALYRAVQFEKENAVNFLLPYLDRITTPDNQIKSPWTFAVRLSHQVFQNLLLRASRAEIERHFWSILHAVIQEPMSPFSVAWASVSPFVSEPRTPIFLDEAVARGNFNATISLFRHMEMQDSQGLFDVKRMAKIVASAASNGHTDIVKFILRNTHVRIETGLKHSKIAFFFAIRRNYAEMLRSLLQYQANITAPVLTSDLTYDLDHKPEPPAVYAARNGLYEVLDVLLAFGADQDGEDTRFGRSVLCWASRNGHADIVRLLIHANIHKADKSGQTALSHAALSGHDNIVKMLLHAGAEVDPIDSDNRTPLILSCVAGKSKQRRRIIEDGSDDIDLLDDEPDAQRPLEGLVESTRLLLEAGADRDYRDSSGRSAFSHAACSDSGALVKLLIEHGVNLDEVDGEGRTALSWACHKGHLNTARTLVEAGCDVSKADSSGKSPLQYAGNYRDDIVRVLYSGS